MEFTGNTALKALKSIKDEVNLLRRSEFEENTYSYLEGETPNIPDYDFKQYQKRYDELKEVSFKIHKALSTFNTSYKGPRINLTVDEILYCLPVYNTRKNDLDRMRIIPERKRTSSRIGGNSEFTVRNFDMNNVNQEYKTLCDYIVDLQEDLNYINSVNTIDIDIDLNKVLYP